MKKLIISGLVLLNTTCFVAQSFNGTIEFRYATQKDTTNNVYWVKDDKVRLDQNSKNGNTVEGSFLFDLSSNEIKFLNPKRKLWGKQKSETPPIIRGQCVTSKGNGSKKVAGVKCSEYIVKNTEENTMITFWVADGQYKFFIPLVKLWNRKDKQSIYFAQLKNLPAGSMPFLSEEKQISDGKVLTKLEVLKISNTAPDNATFEIPQGYSKFDQ